VLLESGVSPYEKSADGQKRPLEMARRRETRELLQEKMDEMGAKEEV